mmetsp:Transcript_6936/g.24507  ORF Transcript_6936/g.24507 Transcript_6936/m.24507 type:complete len:243 (-) Transcript_6936:190-918(-)
MLSPDPRAVASSTSRLAAPSAAACSESPSARPPSMAADVRLTASSSVTASHRPSVASTRNCVGALPPTSSSHVSGSGLSSALGRLKSRSPRARLTETATRDPPGSSATTRQQRMACCTTPPAASTRARSAGRHGLCSSVSRTARPPTLATARLSPACDTNSLRPSCSATSAVHPSCAPLCSASRSSCASSCRKARPIAARTSEASDPAASPRTHRSAASRPWRRLDAASAAVAPLWPSKTPT